MAEQIFLGRYKVTRPLDEGGMSKIYLARQAGSSRDVVVKVLKPEFQAQFKTREHFRREIHIMANFEHPNAVQYLDAGPNDPSGPVLVMEYLRGVDLGVVLHKQGRFTPERAGRLLGQLCDVLQAAHDSGIIHRDIKPGNLMVLNAGLPDEKLKLMDFGLAKMTSTLYIAPDELRNYPEPAASGTPEYICPEEVRGMSLDPRSDLYSVGVVLYEMLAGRRPFEGDKPQLLMHCHEKKTPPTFAEIGLGKAIPPAIEAVVRSCLSKPPDQRPRNATELALTYERTLGKRITQFHRAATSPSRMLAAQTAGGAAGSSSSPSRQGLPLNAVQHSIEAVMPEALAIVKLKGFIYDLGGDVVESVPGKIHVRLGDPADKKKSGLFRWLGSGATATATVTPAMEIEMHMERRDPSQPNRLTITLVINPGRNLVTPDMRNRCNQIGRDLQAYLMGR
jgi:serine/threonine-protein kinase